MQTGYILAYHVSEARDVQAGMLIFPVKHHALFILIQLHQADRIYKFHYSIPFPHHTIANPALQTLNNSSIIKRMCEVTVHSVHSNL